MNDTKSTPVTDALEAQGILQPGQPGWWKVWGARLSDVREGDLIMVKPSDGEITEHEVTSLVYEEGLLSALYLRFIDSTGEDLRIGRLCPVIVLRRGDHNILADSL